jgi:predicted MPP superfamily phosphohydrolase
VKVEVVQSKKLTQGQHLTIAHLSDLHVDRDSRALIALEKALRELKPDLLIFTGDALNSRDGLTRFQQVITSANPRLGRFAVRGNHDVVRWREVDLYGGGIATELLSDQPLVIDHGQIALCGAPFGAGEVLAGCVARAPAEALTIVAFHSPDEIEALEPRPDLYLAGHTHGGQVRVPFYGAIVTFSRFDKRYEMGRYEVNGTTLYVNRGIGFEPFGPRVRFLSRPELTIIQVVPSAAP